MASSKPISIPGLLAQPTTSEQLKEAIESHSGAEFHRCALQVNPFDYLRRHGKQTPFQSEDEYNEALVRACVEESVQVIGITDHFRVETGTRLAARAREAGIQVLLGFEANTREGVHFLCLFPSETTTNDLTLIIGRCGVTNLERESPQGDITCEALLQLVRERGGVCIAAHVCSASGLLTTLKGQARMRVWTCPDLMAVAISGPRDQTSVDMRRILDNSDPQHARARKIAVVNASDVSCPEDLAAPNATTLIKMGEVSVEGMRQAFLDWESRIRLNSDPMPGPHVEIVAASWEGGLLDNQAIRFNPCLNVVIGGRGAGKSTLIESLRYVFSLPPKGDEAQRSHAAFVKNVLRNGTKISVLIRSPRPDLQHYLLECTVPNPPTIRGENGALIPGLKPADLVAGLEIYGQHEISELTRTPEKLAKLLDRFVDQSSTFGTEKNNVAVKLAESRHALSGRDQRIRTLQEQLTGLPALQDKLRRFESAGLKDRLAEKTQLDAESRILSAAAGAIKTCIGEIAAARRSLTIDRSGFSDESLKDLPRKEILARLDPIFSKVSGAVDAAVSSLVAAASQAEMELDAVTEAWRSATTETQQNYERALRDLQKEGVDGADFIKTQTLVASLGGVEAEMQKEKTLREEEMTARRELLAQWEDVKGRELRALERAAKKVGRQLEKRVRVSVRASTSLGSLEQVIRGAVSGQGPSGIMERLRAQGTLSLTRLAEDVRKGPKDLIAQYGISPSSAEKLAAAADRLAMEIEEVDVPAEALIELNVAPVGGPENWKPLDGLSTGQKATAVLLLLLLGSDAPLIIDQPEDDLDNRFITEVVVQTMRKEKQNRQFVFSTHNANIPVLGDAEKIIGLVPVVHDGVEITTIPEHLVGSIDAKDVRELLGTLLEGGREAFELRRAKYGF